MGLFRTAFSEPAASGAAGELCDILGEGLRCKLQPFDRGKIGEDRLSEFLDRQTAFDRKHRRLNAIGALGRQDVRTKKLSAVCLGDQLDEAAGVTRGQRAGNVLQIESRGLDL